MTEDDMFNRIYKYHSSMKGKQVYSQLECIECLKLTNKMLEEEVQLIMANKQKTQRQLQITLGGNYMRRQQQHVEV
jgi:hypothetical protein